MAKLLSFSKLDDRDIEVRNLCLEQGCQECTGFDDSSETSLVICMHGCHEMEAALKERVRQLEPNLDIKR